MPEAEQPYKVPANWCWTRQNIACYLSDIEKIVNGEHPYLEAKFLRGLKKPKIVSAGKFINKSSKVILVDGENSGEVFDIFVDGYMGSTFRLLCFSEIVYEQYCRYFIITNKEIYSKSKKGSAIPHLNKELFFNMPFPLPPLTEQQRIVERIESLFAKLDEGKENLQNVLDGFETRKAAILHKAFTGELTANWRKQHGVSMDSWEEKKLGDVADTQYGYTESASSEAIGPKFLRITDIQNGIVNWDKVPYCRISEEELEKYKLSIEDIVIARTGATTGKSYLIKDNILSVFASYLIRLKLKTKDVLSNFIYQFMQSQLYWTQITDFSKGIAQPGVNAQKLKKIKLSLPTLPEQTEIVRIIDDLLAKEQQAKELAENALAKIELIKKSILARAFRGELGTNNPADEPAVELLKRML